MNWSTQYPLLLRELDKQVQGHPGNLAITIYHVRGIPYTAMSRDDHNQPGQFVRSAGCRMV